MLDSAQIRLSEKQQALDDYREAVAICEAALADSVQAKNRIEMLMNVVFHWALGDAYSFEYKEVGDAEGNITGVQPIIYEHGIGRSPEDYGTGVNNVYNVGMRMILLVVANMFATPENQQAPILLLDEVFSNADLDNWEMLIELQTYMMEALELQCVTITHANIDESNRIIRVVKEGTAAKILVNHS